MRVKVLTPPPPESEGRPMTPPPPPPKSSAMPSKQKSVVEKSAPPRGYLLPLVLWGIKNSYGADSPDDVRKKLNAIDPATAETFLNLKLMDIFSALTIKDLLNLVDEVER